MLECKNGKYRRQKGIKITNLTTLIKAFKHYSGGLIQFVIRN